MEGNKIHNDPDKDLIRVVDAASLKHDPVNAPSHYTDGKIEVIDFIEDKNLGFNLGNAIKYISRAGKKDSGKPGKLIEDLRKAEWYLKREISKLEKDITVKDAEIVKG